MRRFTVPLLGAVTALAFAAAACAGGGIPTAPAAPSTPAPATSAPSTGAGQATTPAPAATQAVSYPPALRSDQQVTIRFESYNLFAAGLLRDATLKLIDNFEKKHPNIKVETKATRDQEIFPPSRPRSWPATRRTSSRSCCGKWT